MPSYHMVTTAYLKQILRGDKKLLKMSDTRMCNPSRYDEISVTQLYESCLKMSDMPLYFPDNYPKGRKCCRQYFFSILATIHPEYTDKLLKKCKEVRYGADGEAQKSELIEMDPMWQDQLKEFPQFASKFYSIFGSITMFLNRVEGKNADAFEGEVEDRV